MDAELPEILRSLLCPRLTPAEAAELAGSMVPFQAPPGRIVMHEGEPSTGVFILLRGTAEIIKRTPDGASRTLATVTAPTVIGEMGLITADPRSASVKAVTACEFQTLARADFQSLLDEQRLAPYKLMATMAEVLTARLAAMNRELVELEERGDRPSE